MELKYWKTKDDYCKEEYDWDSIDDVKIKGGKLLWIAEFLAQCEFVLHCAFLYALSIEQLAASNEFCLCAARKKLKEKKKSMKTENVLPMN